MPDSTEIPEKKPIAVWEPPRVVIIPADETAGGGTIVSESDDGLLDS